MSRFLIEAREVLDLAVPFAQELADAAGALKIIYMPVRRATHRLRFRRIIPFTKQYQCHRGVERSRAITIKGVPVPSGFKFCFFRDLLVDIIEY